jgi:cyanophycinase
MKSTLLAALALTLISAAPLSAQITAESENNNTEAAADGPMGSGLTVSGNIGSNNDADWFYFDVVGSGNINISLDHTSGRDFDFFLYKPTGSYVLSGQSSARPETGTYAATGSLRYKIKVTRYSGTGAYTLNVTFPTGSATPTPTPTPTATPTPTPTATITPTSTPTPTPGGGFGPRPAKPSTITNYILGNSADAVNQPVNGPALLLMGGNFDVDEAILNRAYPVANGGDTVVIRTNASNGYQNYLYNLTTGPTRPDSVETIVIDTVTKANTDYVEWVCSTAEFIYFAGGDQSAYMNAWNGTRLETGVRNAYNRGAVIGGISAGCAIMGDFIYDPDGVTAVISSEALANPYRSSVIISDTLFDLGLHDNIITDTHFAQRDRMGRAVTFLARLRKDNRAASAVGVFVDEDTCLFIDKNRQSVVDGDFATYVVRQDGTTALTQCVSGQPLIFSNLLRSKLTAGGTFNFATNSGSVTPTRISYNGTTSTPTNVY